jgi:putative addiction module CopG family antidote
MEVHLTRDQEAFVQDAINSGRFQRPEEALREALALWEQRERTRAEILAAVDRAESSLARGEGRKISSDSLRQLAHEVKERGRGQLDPKSGTSR